MNAQPNPTTGGPDVTPDNRKPPRRDPGAFLEVRDLTVQFPTGDGVVHAVDTLSFSLQRGRTLGIVGESGSGKSVSSMAIMGLHQGTQARISGQIWLDGDELVGATPDFVRRLRGRKMAMIFQDPLSSLHPFYKVGNQIVEAYRLYNDVSKKAARRHAIDLLGRVGIPEPAARVDAYPHQFSGGMRQRAMIAMALACDPQLLIADEPTTALDVTVQAEILDLIRGLQEEFGSAVIMITHDLGVIAELADDVLVMYGGRAVEKASCRDLFKQPEHPYTWGLLSSMPRLDRPRQERLTPVQGSPPSLIKLPAGCAFNPRCPYCTLTNGLSLTEVPALRPTESDPAEASGAAGHSGAADHSVACHLQPLDRRRIWTQEVQPKL